MFHQSYSSCQIALIDLIYYWQCNVIFGQTGDAAFISNRFNAWKKPPEKGRGFRKHNDLQSHAFAWKHIRIFSVGQ